jgi:hypothetical protein
MNAPIHSFELLQPRGIVQAGTICYRFDGNDYGCCADDTAATGVHHIALCTVPPPNSNATFFTCPVTDFKEIK